MSPSEIITIITAVLNGIAKITKVSREALAKSLEEMASDIRGGGLIPDELLEKVNQDSKKIDSIRDKLPR